MGKLFSYLIFGFAVMTLIMAAYVLKKHKKGQLEDILFVALAVSSTIWSIGFGFLMVQTDTEMAYMLRCVGMVGTFGYLIFATLLMALWNDRKTRCEKIICAFSLTSVFLYPFLMRRSNMTFILTEFGMKYTLKAGLVNNLYTLYCILTALGMLVLEIQMCRNKKRKWIRVMGQSLIVCEMIIIFGMILDTILPLFGVGAFPGSTLTQFFGVALVYRTLMFYKDNNVSIRNMSQFVYYSVESPVLIYDYAKRLKIANKSAMEFLGISNGFGNIRLNELFDIPANLMKSDDMVVVVDADCIVNNAHCRLSINRILDKYRETLGYIIIVDDLTDKIQIINELETARQQADMANRAKTTFLANMSHEIRTPLNTVFGMSEMILREEKSKQIREYAHNIRGASDLLLGIINDILDLSKLEAGKISIYGENYYLPDMIRNVINVISLAREEKGLGFELDVDRSVPAVLYGDELRIKQVITNIMNNAVKYTKKGKISFRLSWVRLSEDEIELRVSVKDTGVGIRKEDMDRLFKPYERIDERRNIMVEGHGLGLAITKELLNLMDGRMEVDSEYGKGSEFTVFIPQKLASEKELEKFRQEKNLPEDFMDLSNEDFITPRVADEIYNETLVAPDMKILVVDDTASNLLVMRELLKCTQIRVDMVKSGADCLKAVERKYDMIFLDHMMPEMDGMETLDRIRHLENNQNSDTPVIAMTANALSGSRQMYLGAGFNDYISKPVNYQVLENIIRKYI